MSAHVFHEIYLHLTWHTKESLPLLTPNLKPRVFEFFRERGAKVLEWQRGFGVVSFGKGNLDWVLAYIANQKAHHAAGTWSDRLERIEFDEGDGPHR